MSTPYGLGRLAAPDPRDRAYPLALARTIRPPRPRQRPYRERSVLDQGQAPICVGASCRGLLEAAPIMVPAATGPSMLAIYHLAQTLDEWPGEGYEGTSVRAGMKALQALGHIASYLWLDTTHPEAAVGELRRFLLDGYGTVVVGTDWYPAMFDVARDGTIAPPEPRTTPVGGHAYRVVWYDARRDAFRVRNSWGAGWGDRGGAWMPTALLAALLGAHGEAAAPTECRVTPRRSEDA